MATESYNRGSTSLGNTIEEKTRTLLGWTESNQSYLAPPIFSTAITHPELYGSGKSSSPPAGSNGKKDRSRKPKTPQRSAPYPYSLVPEGRSRKSSISSVSSGDSSVLKQQLTPPPSPAATTITSNANVTIVSLPRTAQTRLPMASASAPVESPCHRLPDAYNALPISPVSPNTPNPYSCGNQVSKPGPIPVSAPSQQVFERIRELIPNVPTDNNAYRILVQTATSVIELEHKLQNIIQEKGSFIKHVIGRKNQNTIH